MQSEKIVFIGAGGHAKVVLDIIHQIKRIKHKDLEILGFIDDDDSKKEFCGYPVLGKIERIKKLVQHDIGISFINCIGHNSTREQIVKQYSSLDVHYFTAVHPNATIGGNVFIDTGTVVMAGAIINPHTQIGKHAIINTGAIIEHDNMIGDFVHISPGAKCAGTVTVEEGVHVGVGASIIPNITVGERAVIGAGAVVIKDIPANCTAVGVPAKVIKFNK